MYRSSVVQSILLNVAVLGLLAGTFAGHAAAEESARLSVELRVSGSEEVQGDGQSLDHAEGRFDDFYAFAVTLRSSGELNNVNVKDPRFAEQMMARAAAIQGQVQRRQPQPAALPMTPEQLEARAAAGQEACKGDLNCLMSLAQEMQAQMIAMQASPVSATQVEEPEDSYRYLDYFGADDCDGEIHVRIDRVLTGEYSDVQGMVPYSYRRSADYVGTDLQRQMTCLSASLVLDVEDQVFYTDALGLPEATGRYVREVQGRPVDSGLAPLPLHAEVSAWVAQQLRQAPVTGQRRATLALSQDQSGALSTGVYRGEAVVELRWELAGVGPR